MNISQLLTKLKTLVYSKSETDSLLGGKASSSHTHTKSQITDFPTIPSKTSQLTNDSGFLTSHQSLSNYSTKANTVKSLSISGKTITVTPGSGNAYTLTTQDTNTTYSNFVKSGSGAKAGLVPAPSTTAGTTKYLREDGTWQVPPDHTYTVNNATLTIQKNGSNVATFTANASSNATANITVPTKVSQLTNDSGYITSSGSCNYANSAGSASSASSATTAGAVSTSVAAGSTKNLVYATMSNNDQCRIMCGGADNAGYMEIATSDDGNEPIYVRQYNNGIFGSIVRTLTLLDGSGNTQFPGTVTAPTFTGNLTGNCSGSAGSVAWGNVSGRPTIPTKTSQLTNDSGFLTSHQSLSNYSTLANTIKSLSISGKTITYTKGDNTTGTLTTQDTNTTYSAGTNLSLSGTTFNVSSTPSFTSITVSGYKITVD